MSDKQWIEGGRGMYVRVPTRGAFKGEDLYCARIRVNGRYRHVTLGVFSGRRKAEAKLNDVLGDPKAALERRRREVVRFGEVLDRFFNSYRSRNGTSDYYRNVLKAAREHFADTPPSEIDALAIDRYLDTRRTLRTADGKARIGPSTLRKECIALGTAFKWAKGRQLVKENPMRDYSKPKEPKVNEIAILTREQEAKLMGTVCAEKAAGIAHADGVLWNRYRHTWATRLAATGKVSMIQIAEWMGNSVAICEKHYAKYLPGAHDRFRGLLDQEVGKAAPSAAPRKKARLQLVK